MDCMSYRNCCVTFARCDGALSCRNSKSLPGKTGRHSGSKEVFKVTVLVNFCFLRVNEKTSVFPFQETPTLTSQLFRESGSRMVQSHGEMSLYDELILGVCLHHPVFLGDVLSDVIDVSADSVLSNCQSNFA